MLMLASLRLIHIVCGLFWVGAALVLAWFVLPVAQRLGSAGDRFVGALMVTSRFRITLMVAALLNLLSGMALFGRIYGGAWIHSHAGIGFGTGGLLAISALVIGPVLAAPIARRRTALLAELAAGGGQPSPSQEAELGLLAARNLAASRVMSVLLLLAAAAMATARYL